MQKSNIITLFILDIIFSLSLLSFSIFSIKKIYSYIIQIQSLNPELINLQSQLSTQNLSTYSPTAISSTLSQLNSAVNNISLFQYLIIPLTIFLIWSIFQGLTYYQIEKSNNFLKNFLKITIPLYTLFIILVILASNSIMDFLSTISILSPNTSISLIIYLFLFIALFYITLLSYSLMNHKDLIKAIITKLKNLRSILYFLPFLIINLIYFSLFVLAFIYSLTGTIPYYLIFPFMILSIFSIYSKIYFYKKINSNL